MENSIKIELSIGDRMYPITIKESQKEGIFKKAEEINDVIRFFEDEYAIRDKQDALAMALLQFATKEPSKNLFDVVQRRLDTLNHLLDT